MQNAEFSPIVDTSQPAFYRFLSRNGLWKRVRRQLFRYPRYLFTHVIRNSEESESESPDGKAESLDERTRLNNSIRPV
jgi:hypothetical protein